MESIAPVTTETATQTSQQNTPQGLPESPPSNSPSQVNSPETSSPGKSGLDFIPDQYKDSSWAQKYKTAEDFFKGFDNLNKMAGQKQIVQGIQAPTSEASDEDWNKFFTQIGRPEGPDKYIIPEDIQANEGIDLASEKKVFSELAHQSGLTQKQAERLFKGYIGKLNENTKVQEVKTQESFDKALKETFPDNPTEGLAMAKKGAKALGIGTILDDEGLSLHPVVLQLCAKLGELAGEDTFIKTNTPDSSESLMDKAKRLQASPAYWNDQSVFDEVTGLYQKASKNKSS